MNKRGLFIILLVITFGVVGSSCSSIFPGNQEATPTPQSSTPESNNFVISEGNLVPANFTHLAFVTAGEVEEILIKEGDQVSSGQVLVRLGNREQAEAALSAANLELEAAQQALNNLHMNADLTHAHAWQALTKANENLIAAERTWEEIDTDEYQDEVDDANLDVSEANDVLENAQEEFDKYKDLDPENPDYKTAEQNLEDAQDIYNEAVHERDLLIISREQAAAALAEAQASQDKAEQDYNNTSGGPDLDQLTLAESRLDNAQAQFAAAQAGLAHFELLAPFAGVVVDIQTKVGEVIGAGTPAILLADFSQWYVDTNDLTELEVVNLSIGQTAVIRPDAMPEVVLTGEVVDISEMFTSQSGDILYPVRILVNDPDPRLMWGMTVEIEFNNE